MKPIGLEPIQLISKTNALPIKLGFFYTPKLVKLTPAPTSVSTTLLRLSTHC